MGSLYWEGAMRARRDLSSVMVGGTCYIINFRLLLSLLMSVLDEADYTWCVGLIGKGLPSYNGIIRLERASILQCWIDFDEAPQSTERRHCRSSSSP